MTDNVEWSLLGIERRFTELCIYEVLVSDNRTIEEALAAYNESLLSGDDKIPSSLNEVLYSPTVLRILQTILSQVCPGQPACSGRGTCSNSTCTCNTGKLTFISYFIAINSCFFSVCIYICVFVTSEGTSFWEPWTRRSVTSDM